MLGIKRLTFSSVFKSEIIAYLEFSVLLIPVTLSPLGAVLGVINVFVPLEAPGKSACKPAELEAPNNSLRSLNPLILYKPSVKLSVTPVLIVPDVILSRLIPVLCSPGMVILVLPIPKIDPGPPG